MAQKEISIKINFHDTQQQCWQNLTKDSFVICGRRWGKSTLLVTKIVMEALQAQRADWTGLYLLPTRVQAKRTAWKEVMRIVNALKYDTRPKINNSELTLTFANGAVIRFLGTDNYDDLRGMACDFCVIDEFADHKEDLIDAVVRPLLITRNGWLILTGTTKGGLNGNMKKTFDLYKMRRDNDILEKGKSNFSIHKHTSYETYFTLKDGSRKFLVPHSELEEQRYKMADDIFQQEYMAEFKNLDGLIYKTFNRQIHVKSQQWVEAQLRQCAKIVGTIDFGSKAPTAILKVGVTHDGNYIVADEVYETDLQNDDIVNYCRNWTDVTRGFYADPASPDRIKTLRSSGVRILPTNKGKIVEGINMVQNAFQGNRIYISDACFNFIKELEGYSWADNGKEEPAGRQDDHACDAFRYFVKEEESLRNIDSPSRSQQPKSVHQMTKELMRSKYGI